MNLKRFKEIVEAYGADPARWPANERAAAEAFLAASSEARAVRDAEARLDTVLSRAESPAPSTELAARILRTAPTERRTRSAGLTSWLAELWEGPIWQPATALAVSMVLGLAVGAFAPLFPDEGDSGDDEIAGFWLDADDTGWDG
jgi:hypothetical protein